MSHNMGTGTGNITTLPENTNSLCHSILTSCPRLISPDPHLWRALTLGVGRLGIILELTLKIVENQSVKRTKQARAFGTSFT
jgi:hypothetical protein